MAVLWLLRRGHGQAEEQQIWALRPLMNRTLGDA